jgi:hypothetical protein
MDRFISGCTGAQWLLVLTSVCILCMSLKGFFFGPGESGKPTPLRVLIGSAIAAAVFLAASAYLQSVKNEVRSGFKPYKLLTPSGEEWFNPIVDNQ